MTSYHFRCGKPLTSGQKRIAGSWEPEVTWFERGNRWRVWKKDRGLKGKETRGENAGSKSKVQVGEEGWSFENNTNKNKSYFIDLFYNNGGFPLSSYLIRVSLEGAVASDRWSAMKWQEELPLQLTIAIKWPEKLPLQVTRGTSGEGNWRYGFWLVDRQRWSDQWNFRWENRWEGKRPLLGHELSIAAEGFLLEEFLFNNMSSYLIIGLFRFDNTSVPFWWVPFW